MERITAKIADSTGAVNISTQTITVLDGSESPPDTPTGFDVINDTTDVSKVILSWNDTDNETGYTIERQSKHPKNGKWVGSTLINRPADLDTYSDAPGDGIHRYRIQASNSYGLSGYTSWIEVPNPVSGGSTGGNTGGNKGGGKGKNK